MSHPTDETNTTHSLHQTQVAGKSATATAIGSGHTLEVRGDYGVWDNVSNRFVLVDQTTFGTSQTPKNQ